MTQAKRIIGTLNEGALHAALKQHYGGSTADFEVSFSGFVADVVRDGVIFEIQTSSFSGLERKMRALAEQNAVVLVHPIAAQKHLVRIKDPHSGDFSRRKSPKKGGLCHILSELVYLPTLLNHPNFSVEVALIEEEQHSVYDPKARRGRGGWRTRGRHLVELVEQLRLNHVEDLLQFIPEPLASTFSVQDLAAAMGQPVWLARQMAYCLRHGGLTSVCGKQGNALVYEFVS
ncbi:MAG: hypothetical protein CBC52_004200 [Gammaproteobacteria bacterium TMED92]|nr:MAG: hypothetical protein CBC52_004200 [Gammaproteobacteria bacterium TMED92]